MSYEIQVYPDHGYNRVARVEWPRYIAVHYTADGTPDSHTAYNSMLYFSRANRNASAHYFIDNYEIWQFQDPAAWCCWHVGDGHGVYGITNQNSIGIEVVQDTNAPFSAEEIDKLHWLVRLLMERFGIDADHVVRHYDASRKLCPWYYTEGGAGGDAAWWALHSQITAPYAEPYTPVEIDEVADGVHRLYNPSNGDHHFTQKVDEARWLQAIGWHYEGIAWVASSAQESAPVYRMYNPFSGEHLFTMDSRERETLRRCGWTYEGVAWRNPDGGVKVYRLYNPYVTVGSHHYTIWKSEADDLVANGWILEDCPLRGIKHG